MKEILVDLGERSYRAYIGRETLSMFGEVCRTSNVPQQVVVVTDKNVARLYLRQLSSALKHVGYSVESIVISPGEHQKSLFRANAIVSKLLHLGVSRETTLVALGGGVIGDLTGFVAANFRRGAVFVQCPTTLLSQVDSSIGGKVGVNHPRRKNAISTFYQPRLVFSDIALLRSLPRRELVSGLGEVVKYGIIAGEDLFRFLENHLKDIQALDLDVIEETALRCISFKGRLVSEDEREAVANGGRGMLNLGHAVGQVLEGLSNYSLRHGEAVLLGLRMELAIAKELRLLSETTFETIRDYYNGVDFQFSRRPGGRGARLFNPEKLIRALKKDRFVLPTDIGKVTFRADIPEPVLRKALAEFF